MSDSNDEEKLAVAAFAVTASEMAAENIRRYLKAHAEQASVVKPVNRVMKIMDDLTEEMKASVSNSARIASKSLRAFTGDE